MFEGKYFWIRILGSIMDPVSDIRVARFQAVYMQDARGLD